MRTAGFSLEKIDVALAADDAEVWEKAAAVHPNSATGPPPSCERFRALNRERKTQEEITQALVKEFNWGTGPAAGNVPGMMQELR